MALTAQQIIDDSAYELFMTGVASPDTGRLMRLLNSGEDEYARYTGCLYKEDSLTTTAGTYDYTLNSYKNSGRTTINVNSTAKTFTRTTGSFITDGFVSGDTIVTTGFSDGTNNTTKIIGTVSTLVITVTSDAGLVTRTGDGDEKIRSGTVIAEIHAVKYQTTPLRLLSYRVHEGMPSYYYEDYPELATFVGINRIRLGFNPATGAAIKYLYSYEPHTNVYLITDALTLNETHKTALTAYVLWHYMLPLNPEKAVIYRDNYLVLTKMMRDKTMKQLMSAPI